MFGLECVVYMGAHDCERQHLNVVRMQMLGAEVIGVEAGQRTLKEAINEAMRDWVTNVRHTHYILGTAYGAHPYPVMVRNFHRVIGDEARRQILQQEEALPDLLVACVGGGSNAMGIFSGFVETDAELVGVEHVAIGSDFDGLGTTPAVVPDVSQLPLLTQSMLAHGLSEAEVAQIWGGNFARLLHQTIDP